MTVSWFSEAEYDSCSFVREVNVQSICRYPLLVGSYEFTLSEAHYRKYQSARSCMAALIWFASYHAATQDATFNAG